MPLIPFNVKPPFSAVWVLFAVPWICTIAPASGPFASVTIPETVGGNGVKFTRVGATVGEAVGGGRVAEERFPVEVGSDDPGWVTEVGNAVAGLVGVGECDETVVGDTALAWSHAANPSTSRAPIKTTHIALLIRSPDYLPTYGSAASRRPSPKKLKPNTAVTMKAIGAKIQAFWPRV